MEVYLSRTVTTVDCTMAAMKNARVQVVWGQCVGFIFDAVNIFRI